MNYLGDILRERRRALELSQDAVQERLFGHPGGFMSDIERGVRPFPVARLDALAGVLGETADWWRRVVDMHAALSRIPDEARRLHPSFELMADMHVAGTIDPRMGYDLAGWLKGYEDMSELPDGFPVAFCPRCKLANWDAATIGKLCGVTRPQRGGACAGWVVPFTRLAAKLKEPK